MSSSLRYPLLCVAAALVGAFAVSRPAAAAWDRTGNLTTEAAADLMRLVEPAPGTTLVAGSTVVVEWQAGPGLAAMPHADEWEVFLSLDGGRTFLTRLTPHLDLTMRRVMVRLPQVPSEDARLLLRVGDERDERGQAVPGRYRIVAGQALTPSWRWPRLGRGEPARPGAPGVLAWVEGSRDGARWQEVEGGRGADVWMPAMASGEARLAALGPVPSPEPKLARAALAAFDSRALAVVAPATAPADGAKAPRLSVLCRRNV